MVDQVEIQPSGPIDATIRPPSSKSITNRALICAALADGTSVLKRPLESDDTAVMVESLRRLGIEVGADGERLTIVGRAGKLPVKQADLFIGNSGTSVRFLTAMLSVCHGEFRLDGVPRMRERPIQDLIEALNDLGSQVSSIDKTGCPPVLVRAAGLAGGRIRLRGDVSSQFLSGLLMAAPYAKRDVSISIEGELVSRPYVDMTIQVMRRFGVHVSSDRQEFQVAPGNYQPLEMEIEPDASAASYFWAAAAITGGKATVIGLDRDSLQGDVGFCDLLVRMGCQIEERTAAMTLQGTGRLTGIDCNMNEISDTVQTLAAVALFAEGSTTIRGVAHNRHKETDRIGNLAIELRKFGATVTEREDGLTIEPPESLTSAHVDTYDDHRMAMSLALPGLRIPGVVVRDPGCSAKTYPSFFADLAAVTKPTRA
jgi:3-phosphoshikimate 1-carboxyvinyltransferase